MMGCGMDLVEQLAGTWFVSGRHFHGEGILVITPDGRVVQFQSAVKMPRKNETLRLHVAADVDGHLRFRRSPDDAGWLRGIEFSGPGWTMIAHENGEEFRFPCRHASAPFLPDWFEEQLAVNLDLLDARSCG
ncbi:MAG: hypothetical protein EOP88_07690 [Verrucomicrobiaceae bacterium]|nr:MAG: hypothetical protein EOP88_07690 [Verrucomicrobiaceae bacterium]